MRFIFRLIILFSLITIHAAGQDQIVDLIAKAGTDQGEFSAIHFVNSKTFVAAFEKQILLMNLEGEILEKSPNPIAGKKLKYNHFISKNNYSVNDDVFFTADGYDKMIFIRNYSSNTREICEIPVPEVEGLKSGRDKYNATASYLSSWGSIVDQKLFFINKDLVVMAETYFSMTAKLHGASLPEKEKYHTFMRLIYIDLSTKIVSEEYVLKDILSIPRDKSNNIDFKILKYEDDHIQVGVLESNSKLISPAAHGFSYEGNYTVYAYDVKTKTIMTVAKQVFNTEPKAVNSILVINENDLSITWNERIPDGFSLHNKTYRLSENMDFDSSIYHLPVEVIKHSSPSFSPVYEYENIQKEHFCAVGLDILQNKGDKNPISAYLVIKPTGEYKIIKRTGNSGIRFSDRRSEREYDLELEGETYEEFCGFFSKILDKNYEGRVSNGNYVRHSGEVILFENGKTVTYSSMVSENASGMKLKTGDYVATFYFYDYKF